MRYAWKRIEECIPGDELDMGIFLGIDEKTEGQGENTHNVRIQCAHGIRHYTETKNAKVRIWK